MSKLLKRTAVIFLVSVFISVLIKIFVLQLYDYRDDSMERSIGTGEKLIINKTVKGKINDIILFKDSAGQLFLSRIIGIENDEVIRSNRKITVNGNEAVNEKSLNEYCLKFINIQESEELKKRHKLKPVNRSGTYNILLTSKEYDDILKDSLSSISDKIFPFSDCSYNFNEFDDTLQKIIVSRDSVFVLNDNRTNHNDSRTFGLIDKKNIVGKLIYFY